MSTTTTRNHNTLRPEQRYRLFQALDRDRELVPKYRRADMVARYTEELGFALTAANVDHAAKAVGVKFRAGGSVGTKRASRVARLERAMRELCKQLGVDYASLSREG